MSDVYIVSAARTPVGAFQGALKTQTAVDLGVTAAQAAIERSGLQPGQVDEAYIGCVLQGGVGQAPARQVVLRAGCGDATEATTVNKVCASGLKAVALGAQSIQLGHAQVVLAGGMESMSNAPFYLPRGAPAYGNITALDAVQNDGLTDAQDKFLMGVSADATAAKHGISRDDQDTYAVSSYERANAAWDSLAFEDEIVPVILKDKKGNVTNVAQDEGFRHYNADKMRTLRPAFGKDGTVTAANASSLNDGASALLLAGAQTVQDAGLKPLAKIVATADAACAPIDFPTAPALAIPKALERAGLSIEDIALFEINEAFAVVALANTKILGLDAAKVNTRGGGVALGHPIGSSGARILVTLVHALKKGEYGVAGICNGGGGASAIVVQRV